MLAFYVAQEMALEFVSGFRCLLLAIGALSSNTNIFRESDLISTLCLFLFFHKASKVVCN